MWTVLSLNLFCVFPKMLHGASDRKYERGHFWSTFSGSRRWCIQISQARQEKREGDMLRNVGPCDFHDAENTDGITEDDKNGIGYKTQNIMEFASCSYHSVSQLCAVLSVFLCRDTKVSTQVCGLYLTSWLCCPLLSAVCRCNDSVENES